MELLYTETCPVCGQTVHIASRRGPITHIGIPMHQRPGAYQGWCEYRCWAQYDGAKLYRTSADAGLPAPTPEQLERWGRLAEQIASQPPLYIRFGRLPRSGRSRNHDTGELEAGVSCYPAVEQDGIIQFAPDGVANPLSFLDLIHRPAYLVTGEEVGEGSDGEPLLHRPRVLAKLIYDRDRGGWRRLG
jgi:hypothetical protein